MSGSFRNGSRLRFSTRMTVFAGTGLIRLETTLQNPSRARHRGNFWDLGDPASILLSGVSFDAHIEDAENRCLSWIDRPTVEKKTTTQDYWEFYQESSGGKNWRSRNHLNRSGEVPMHLQGYRVTAGKRNRHGATWRTGR